MKQALLLAALLGSGASAVNLSNITPEDVCVYSSSFNMIVKDSKGEVTFEDPDKIEYLYSMLENSGFVMGNYCKYSIIVNSDSVHNPELNEYTSTSRLLIHLTENLSKRGNINIASGYSTYTEVKSNSLNDLKVHQLAVFTALIMEFLHDWKQAHP